MYIDPELYKKAGRDPDKPPKPLDDWLAAMKKLTVLDAKGEPTQVGFALRHKGHPVGITDKFLPFAHAFAPACCRPVFSPPPAFPTTPKRGPRRPFSPTSCQKPKGPAPPFPPPRTAFARNRPAATFA